MQVSEQYNGSISLACTSRYMRLCCGFAARLNLHAFTSWNEGKHGHLLAKTAAVVHASATSAITTHGASVVVAIYIASGSRSTNASTTRSNIVSCLQGQKTNSFMMYM